MSKTIILIPSRMSASRLPGKPLLKINGLSIITHVFNKAKKTNLGRVVVCTEDKEVFTEIKKHGGEVVLTSKNHKSGSDRIYEAFKILKIEHTDLIFNLQGDEPNIDVKDLINLHNSMTNNNSDIGTLATKVKDTSILKNENIVKVILKEELNDINFPHAFNFTRNYIKSKSEHVYHHIGVYIYRLSILEKFINFEQSKNEIHNRLEQMRALDNDIKINVRLAKSTPIGVDTMEDYLALKKIMEYKS